MELNYSPKQLEQDGAAEQLIRYLADHEEQLSLKGASIYYEFPLYKDENKIITTKVLVVSRRHGVVMFGTCNAEKHSADRELRKIDSDVDQIFTNIYARLIRNRALRKTKTDLHFSVTSAIFAPNLEEVGNLELESPLLTSLEDISLLLEELETEPLSKELMQEALSTIEGTKGLLRPKERNTEDAPQNSLVVNLARLEEEINRFDKDQKDGYMAVLDGLQRVRGLAGSGKTVVLAMKAALTHLRHPEARIGFTFYTKSLYQHVQRLITRFYRQFDDQDPNWEKLIILHAWGGRTNPGVYYNACVDHGRPALTYKDAALRPSKSAFDAACMDLLSQIDIRTYYDYMFIDEAQDFPASFVRLSAQLTKSNRVVFAYDQLQTIFQTETPTVAEIFGTDEEGKPLIDLEEDVVLHRCYRNPREILVCAHALGFGIYGPKIVQMLENKEHWEDLGYRVLQGEFRQGEEIVIERPKENSPNTISSTYSIDEIVSASTYSNGDEEVAAVAERIATLIRNEGLRPDDILVVAADDRYARTYFSILTNKLLRRRILVNNLQLDSYSLQDFVEENRVTLSTVHKAKGNESYYVFVLGIDALYRAQGVRTRNMIFTAMTRAKAWLAISGVGPSAEAFKRELEIAKKEFPKLKFRYPSAEELQIMRRDITASIEHKLDRTLDELQGEMPTDDFVEILERRIQSVTSKRGKKGGRPRKKK